MAHIELRRKNGRPEKQLVINGEDVTMDVYSEGMGLVEVGEGPFAEVGFQVTFVVSRFDLDNEVDVDLTDHLPAVATRVRSIDEQDA